MLPELQSLSEKTDTLIGVVNQLRQENTRLRNQNAQLSADHKALEERLNRASEKLENLIAQLP